MFVTLLPVACAAQNLSTRQGKFVNLVRVLADSGRLDDPEEAGRLLGTRFQIEGNSTLRDDPATCVNEPANELRIRSTVTSNYVPVTPFWFTDEMRAAGGQPDRSFSYTVVQVTACKGIRYREAKISFTDVSPLFCVRVEDLLAAAPAGLAGGAPYPGDPNWGLYWDAWTAEDTGTRAILDWPHTGNVDEHGDCLRETILRQDASFSARVRRIEKRQQRNAPLMGSGSGTATDGR